MLLLYHSSCGGTRVSKLDTIPMQQLDTLEPIPLPMLLSKCHDNRTTMERTEPRQSQIHTLPFRRSSGREEGLRNCLLYTVVHHESSVQVDDCNTTASSCLSTALSLLLASLPTCCTLPTTKSVTLYHFITARLQRKLDEVVTKDDD